MVFAEQDSENPQIGLVQGHPGSQKPEKCALISGFFATCWIST
jgi:hypothetical protein